MQTLDKLDSFLTNIAELHARVLKRRRAFLSYSREQATALKALSPNVTITQSDITTASEQWGAAVLDKAQRITAALSQAEKKLDEIKAYLDEEAHAGHDIVDALSLLEKPQKILADLKGQLALVEEGKCNLLVQSAKEISAELKEDIGLAKKYLKEDFEKTFIDYGGKYVKDQSVWCGDPMIPNNLAQSLVELGLTRINQYKHDHSADAPVLRPLADLNGDEANASSTFPKAICLGHTQTTITGGPFFAQNDCTHLKTPRMVDFPLPRPLVYDNNNDLATLLLRLVFALPHGRLKIAVIDTEEYGKCITRLNGLGKIKNLVTICNTPNECATFFEAMDKHIGDAIKKANSQGLNWSDDLPYHVVVIDSLAGISTDKYLLLKKMLASGTMAGVLTLISKTSITHCRKIGETESIAQDIAKMDLPSLRGLLEDANEQ